MTTTVDLNRLVNAIHRIIEANDAGVRSHEPMALPRAIADAKTIADDVSRTYCLDGTEIEEDEDEPEFVPPPGVMTFEEFQATKKYSDDLRRDLPDQFAHEDYPGVPTGNIYDGTYFIDEVQDWWPEEARGAGHWHLILERSEFIERDLESLERLLYRFAVQSGGLRP
jgi:hypothetical protein